MLTAIFSGESAASGVKTDSSNTRTFYFVSPGLVQEHQPGVVEVYLSAASEYRGNEAEVQACYT
jgi:hypothetical protein